MKRAKPRYIAENKRLRKVSANNRKAYETERRNMTKWKKVARNAQRNALITKNCKILIKKLKEKGRNFTKDQDRDAHMISQNSCKLKRVRKVKSGTRKINSASFSANGGSSII